MKLKTITLAGLANLTTSGMLYAKAESLIPQGPHPRCLAAMPENIEEILKQFESQTSTPSEKKS
jgi:hypothetical protein